MTTLNSLKKIIPPDQALANKALARALGQVKDIFDTSLPEFAAAVTVLESNKDLNLINSLQSPLPQSVANYWANTFATGTGPNNTVTINDVIGTAAGATMNDQLPVVTSTVLDLEDLGALDSLTANAGAASSNVNGLYTQMEYCLANAYGSGPVTIPSTSYWAGGTFTDFDDAFGNGLIPAANSAISNIANAYPSQALVLNQGTDLMAGQLVLNVTNCTAAGIDIGNVVNDIANANLIANNQSSTLTVVGQLHDIGLDITAGGAAQWFEAVADVSTLTGQAVIASMREGRNIAVLSAVGINLDTQLPDVNPNPVIANNLSNAQYSVSEAQANIQY